MKFAIPKLGDMYRVDGDTTIGLYYARNEFLVDYYAPIIMSDRERQSLYLDSSVQSDVRIPNETKLVFIGHGVTHIRHVKSKKVTFKPEPDMCFIVAASPNTDFIGASFTLTIDQLDKLSVEPVSSGNSLSCNSYVHAHKYANDQAYRDRYDKKKNQQRSYSKTRSELNALFRYSDADVFVRMRKSHKKYNFYVDPPKFEIRTDKKHLGPVGVQKLVHFMWPLTNEFVLLTDADGHILNWTHVAKRKR